MGHHDATLVFGFDLFLDQLGDFSLVYEQFQQV